MDPKAESAGEYITVTPSPEMRAAILAAAGLTDLTDREDESQEPSQHDDAQAARPVDTNADIPAEIAELRDLAATAASNLMAAEQAEKAARDEWHEAQARYDSAGAALVRADRAEHQARYAYLDALRKHGYVQTADGPKPAAPPSDATRCDADWGSATQSQRCVRNADHYGVHIDASGREFGYTPDPAEDAL